MTPKWATELMTQVLADAGYGGPPVELRWRRGGRERVGFRPDGGYIYGKRTDNQSSGRAHYGTDDGKPHIVVTTGTDRRDQRLVLLHELAHILTPKAHHGPAFWDQAWSLYRRYGVPIRYAQKREYGYRKGARAGYQRTRS